MASIDLRPIGGLPGAHNHQNACAAYAAARSLGLAPRQIEAAFASYPGLPHRSQPIATWRGVSIVNDSKATNVDAAEKALSSFERIRWIAGGRPKEGGIAALRPLFPRVAKAYLIGEAAEDFAATLGETPHAIVGTWTRRSPPRSTRRRRATPCCSPRPAPASTSTTSFEHRGEHFTGLVRARIGCGRYGMTGPALPMAGSGRCGQRERSRSARRRSAPRPATAAAARR